MSAFPTLSSQFRTFPQEAVDYTITSTSEAGYKQTRPRFTRNLRKFGPITMVLNAADCSTLESFDATVTASVIFTVIHPRTSEVINVRFAADGRPKITEVPDTSPLNRLYNVEFTLEEA